MSDTLQAITTDALRRMIQEEIHPIRIGEQAISRQTRITVGLAWAMCASIIAGLVAFYSTIASLDEKYVIKEIFEVHMAQARVERAALRADIQEMRKMLQDRKSSQDR